MAEAPASNSPVAPPPSVLAAEGRAREYLAQQKWRKARDEVKPLVKFDRGRFLPLLIQANLGLAREMNAKGQVAEARQVLAYLRTVAPAEQIGAIELELAGQSETPQQMLAKAAVMLAAPTGGMPDTERLRLADQMILAFAPVPEESPETARLAAETRAIQSALQALSDRQWERVSELLRSIPRRSAFSHWALFIRALVQFYTGQAARAARGFEALPPDSAPGKACRGYLFLTGRSQLPKENKLLAEKVVEQACQIARQPGAGLALLLADQLWKAGQYERSYQALRKGVTSFPTHACNWLGVLSDFYFHAPPQLPAAARDPYLDFFSEMLANRSVKNGIEEMLILRMFALANRGLGDGDELREDWEGFLRLYQQFYHPKPRLVAAGYAWLGEQLARVDPASTFYDPRRPRLRNPEGARVSLERAIELDPDNLGAHLALCLVYEALKQTPERNRLLDRMTERFPEDKQVLVRAAAACFERKAFGKGLEFLERAHRLDQLDPQIPDLMALGRLRLARLQFQQKRPDKARLTLDPVQELVTDKPDNLRRGRWSVLVRHGLMEELWGDAERGRDLVLQARRGSPSAVAFLFFAHLAHRVYAGQNRMDSPFLAELRAELKKEPGASRALSLLQILNYWEHDEDKPSLNGETGLLQHYLKTAARRPCTRAEARQLVELIGRGQFTNQARAFVKAILRQDPKDPLFRLYRLEEKLPWNANRERDRTELRNIIEEARRRGDHETAQRAEGKLKSLDRPPPAPLPGPDIWAEKDDFEDEEFEPGFPGMPDMGEFTELMDILSRASEGQIKELRRTMPEDQKFMFDEMLKAARKRKQFPLPSLPPLPPLPPPLKPPARPPAPPPTPRTTNPNQMDLL